MRVDSHRAICALTGVLDFVGIDDVQHGKRVAWMAEAVARELGWSEARRSFVFYAGMVHDCGVSRADEHRHLSRTLLWDGAERHCLRGEAYLRECPPLSAFAEVVRWHHTPWSSLICLPLAREAQLCSNLVFLADRVDMLQLGLLKRRELDEAHLRARDSLLRTVRELAGSQFAPELVEAFEVVARQEPFWLGMDPEYLPEYVEDYPLARPVGDFDAGDVLALSRLFARIVDGKSEYTHEHSLRVAKVARRMIQLLGASTADADQLEVAALLHDIGKMRLPDELLDKPGRLTRIERAALSRHSYDTFRVLSRVFPNSPIPRWAASQHQNLIGAGNPFGARGEQVDRETLLLAVAEVLQALSQERPYRGRLGSHDVGMRLEALRDEGHLDARMVSLALINLEELYHLATAG